MPPVGRIPPTLYSEIRSDKLSPAVAGRASRRIYRAEPAGQTTVTVIDPAHP